MYELDVRYSSKFEWNDIECVLHKFKRSLKILSFSKTLSLNANRFDNKSLGSRDDVEVSHPCTTYTTSTWKISHVRNWCFPIHHLSLFPYLYHVNFGFNNIVDDSDILNLIHCCPLLTEINLSFCPMITAQSIVYVADMAASLVFLDCEGNDQLCGTNFIILATKQRKIQYLNISGVSSVGICDFIVYLAETNGESLCALLLDDLDIDHHVLQALSCNCPCLSLLSITETDDNHLELGIPCLVGCDSLSILIISNCSNAVQHSLSALIDVYVELI